MFEWTTTKIGPPLFIVCTLQKINRLICIKSENIVAFRQLENGGTKIEIDTSTGLKEHLVKENIKQICELFSPKSNDKN